MADLEADLERGGLNWFDSGGTYDPFQTGPAQPFGPHYTSPPPEETGAQPPLKSPIARGIQTLTWIAFAIFAIGVLFFLEPIAAIFYR